VAAYQQEAGWLIARSPFTAILAIAFFVSMAGKLGIKPFDIPDARQEIVAGPLTEASGSILAVFELSRMMRLFVVTTLFVDLFLGGGGGGVLGLVAFLLKSLGVVAAAALQAGAGVQVLPDRDDRPLHRRAGGDHPCGGMMQCTTSSSHS
jgi:formate hydrogenlyase subunit 4